MQHRSSPNYKIRKGINIMIYFGNLIGPVEQSFGTNVALIFSNVVKQATEWQELSDQHELSSHANSQYPHTTGMFNRGHDSCFLQEFLVLGS